MNIKDPVWGPVIPRAFQPETFDNTTAQANASTAIALNETDAITSAISMSGGYLWSFKIYWIITAPVTFATILLPLVAGPIVRYIVKFSYHNRAYSRIALSVLGVAGEAIAAASLPFFAYLIIFGFAYGTLALVMLSRASLSGRNQLLWASFAAVFAYSFLVDFYVDVYIQITGFMPLVFLILALFRSDIRRVLPRRSRMSPIARLLNPWRKYRQLRWVSIILYYTLASFLCIYEVYRAWEVIIVALIILAINRLIRSSVSREHVVHWRIYGLLLVLSAAIDYTLPTYLLLFLPITYAFAIWISQDLKKITIPLLGIHVSVPGHRQRP